MSVPDCIGDGCGICLSCSRAFGRELGQALDRDLNTAKAEAVLAFAAWLNDGETDMTTIMARSFITAQGWPLPKEGQ